MTTDRATAENLTAPPPAKEPEPGHPRPSVIEAHERSHMRRALDDDKQRKIWLTFYVGMAVLVVVGLAFGVRQKADAGEALPPPPAAR